MDSLKEIIDLVHKISERLDREAAEESKFCYSVSLRLEQMSWELYRTANELNLMIEWGK